MQHLWTLISLMIAQQSNADLKGVEKTANKIAALAKKLGAK